MMRLTKTLIDSKMTILWPFPQDLDNDVSLMLSAEHKEKKPYSYDIIKLTFRNKHYGQQGKAIQLLSMKGEEDPVRYEPLSSPNRTLCAASLGIKV
jgi:hypothetical protein